MDTNKRYNQEKILGDRLDNLEQPLTELDIDSFEQMLDDKSENKSSFYLWPIMLFFSALVLVGSYLIINDLESIATPESISEEVTDIEQSGMILHANIYQDSNNAIQTESLISEDLSLKINEDDFDFSSNISAAGNEIKPDGMGNSVNLNYRIDSVNDVWIEDSDFFRESKQEQVSEFFIQEQDEGTYQTSSEKELDETSKFASSRKKSQAKVTELDLLQTLNSQLVYTFTLKGQKKKRGIVDVVSPILKRVSFGFNYSIGRVYANEYTQRALAEFPVEVVDGNTLAFGLLGQYQFTNSLFVRPRFMYHRIEQLQSVFGMRFPTGSTSASLAAVDHELGIGMDVGFVILPDFHGFCFSIGAGASYRYSISTESDNFYTNPELGLEIENVTETKPSRISYNAFLLLEKSIGNVVLGMSPSFILHDRYVDHQTSFVLGDDARYDMQSSMTFSIRFK